MADEAQESKIIRTPTFAGGGVTEEELAEMKEHTKKWVGYAFRTDPIEPDKIVPALRGLYAAAKLEQPRIIIVPSPLVMAVAGGFAAGIWWLREQNQKEEYTSLKAIGEEQVVGQTFTATYRATMKAVDVPTGEGFDVDQISDVVRPSKEAVMDSVPDNKNWIAEMAKKIDSKNWEFLVRCVSLWYRMYQGGNMWASWDCYLTAARDILGLRLPQHENYAYWEQAAINGGFRIMHAKFCMVSDFPEIIKIDDQNQPHSEDGPSHRWRDGWELYHWHGVRVPKQVILAPETLTIEQITKEDNAEVRRCMVERIGTEKFVQMAKLKTLHVDEMICNQPAIPVSEAMTDKERLVVEYRKGKEIARLLECESVKDRDGRSLKYVQVSCPSTGRGYYIRVRQDITRAYEGVASTFGMTEEQYKNGGYLRQGDVQLVPVNHKIDQAHS